MVRRKISFIIGGLLLLSVSASAQSSASTPLKVGAEMPDIIFSDVHHYTQKKVSVRDFRGKWLILDYWTAFCSTCIESQPKMDTLQRTFKDDVHILLVGFNGVRLNRRSDSLIQSRFEKKRKEFNMDLAVAYDSLSFYRFDIWATPYIVVIDREGIIRAVTTRINREQTKALLEGREVVFDKALTRTERRIEIKKKYEKTPPDAVPEK